MKRFIPIVLVAAVLGFGAGRAVSALAQDSGTSAGGVLTPGGTLVRDYLKVLESGKPDVIRKFLEKRCAASLLERLPLSLLITFNRAPYLESGGLGYDFHRVLPGSDHELGALIRNRLTGAWLRLSIPVAKYSPDKISGLVELKPISVPVGEQSRQKLTDAEILGRLGRCMARLEEEDEFSGAVLVAKNGTPLFQEVYGLASKSYLVPNRLDTRFNIASVGKMFTGVAVAQLVQGGKLSFEDSLDKYLPADWLDPHVSRKIQIRHLLTHTSGLGDYFRKLRQQPLTHVFRGVGDYRPLIIGEKLEFEPGTKWSYSNTGILLAGVVIEQVTGESYFDYVREHIFEKAGMLETGAFEKDHPLPNRSTGYMKVYAEDGPEWVNNLYSPVMKAGPSGGFFSTVEDMLRFATALQSYRLLSPEYTKTVVSAKPEIGSPFYGYGFFVSRGNTGRVISHEGDGTGIQASFRMYLDLGYVVVVLSNYGRPSASIVDHVMEQMMAACDKAESTAERRERERRKP